MPLIDRLNQSVFNWNDFTMMKTAPAFIADYAWLLGYNPEFIVGYFEKWMKTNNDDLESGEIISPNVMSFGKRFQRFL